MTTISNFVLRLPVSLKAAAEKAVDVNRSPAIATLDHGHCLADPAS